jgi:hypothetical protein
MAGNTARMILGLTERHHGEGSFLMPQHVRLQLLHPFPYPYGDSMAFSGRVHRIRHFVRLDASCLSLSCYLVFLFFFQSEIIFAMAVEVFSTAIDSQRFCFLNNSKINN